MNTKLSRLARMFLAPLAVLALLGDVASAQAADAK